MTRGRKKDLTIPPSRALAQQRDYRARKAQYVSELEERCRRAEDENAQLRKELEMLKASVPISPVLFTPQTAQASSELMQSLSAASASLARFQQLAFTAPESVVGRSGVRPPSLRHQEASSPGPHNHSHKRSRTEEFPTAPSSERDDPGNTRRSQSVGSDCCGGIMDCRDLVEEGEEKEEREGEGDPSSTLLTRTSEMRSTSDDNPSLSTLNYSNLSLNIHQ